MRSSQLIAIYLPGCAIAYSRVISQVNLVIRNDVLPGIVSSVDDLSNLQRRSPIPGSRKSGGKRKTGGADSAPKNLVESSKKQRANPPGAGRPSLGVSTRSQAQGKVAEGATQAKGKEAAHAKEKETSRGTAQIKGKGTAQGRAQADSSGSSGYNNPANLARNIREQHPTLGKRPIYGGMSPITVSNWSYGSPASPAGDEGQVEKRPPFSREVIPTRAGAPVAGFGKLTGPGYLRTKGSQQSPKVIAVPPGKTLSTTIYDPHDVSVQAEMLEHRNHPSTGREMRVETTGVKAFYSVKPGFHPEVNRQAAFMSGSQKIVGKLDGTPGHNQKWLLPDLPDGQLYDHGAELKGATGMITGSTATNRDRIEAASKVSKWKPLHPIQGLDQLRQQKQQQKQKQQQQKQGQPLEQSPSQRLASSQFAVLNQLPPGPSLHQGSSQQFAQSASKSWTFSPPAQTNPSPPQNWGSSFQLNPPQHQALFYPPRTMLRRPPSIRPEQRWQLTPPPSISSSLQPAAQERLDTLQQFNIPQSLNIAQQFNMPQQLNTALQSNMAPQSNMAQQFNIPQQFSTAQQHSPLQQFQWNLPELSPTLQIWRQPSPDERDNTGFPESERRG